MNLERRFQSQCRASITRFRTILPVPWCSRGILLSEGFAVCAMCDMFGVRTMIESGIHHGRSTRIWSKYLTTVTAIDFAITAEARKALGDSGTTLLAGNGTSIVLREIDKSEADAIVVFIDGPKDAGALDIVRRALSKPSVRFVAIHDVPRLRDGGPNKFRRLLAEHSGGTFFTDAKWFTDEYSWLDKDESRQDEKSGMRWVPGELIASQGKGGYRFGSYGPTVGFMINIRGLDSRAIDSDEYVKLQLNII